MQRLQIQLILGFDRHESHGGPLHGLTRLWWISAGVFSEPTPLSVASWTDSRVSSTE
jgi:hypothetical protein